MRPVIDLYHSTREAHEAALERLAADARNANVHLHVLIDDRDGHLSGERIRVEVPGWRDAALCRCRVLRYCPCR